MMDMELIFESKNRTLLGAVFFVTPWSSVQDTAPLIDPSASPKEEPRHDSVHTNVIR